MIKMKQNSILLGLSGGIVFGGALLILTLLATFTGYAVEGLTMLTHFYPGYSISIGGSIIALIYGFIDGFILLFSIKWVYHYLGGK